MARQLWRVLVAGTRPGRLGAYACLWVTARELGEALAGAEDAARRLGLRRTWPVEVEPQSRPADDARALGPGLWCASEIEVYPLGDAAGGFRLPIGVVPGPPAGGIDPETIRAGFKTTAGKDFSYTAVVVAANALFVTFSSFIRGLPAADALELRLRDRWLPGVAADRGGEDVTVYLNQDLASKRAILDYLARRKTDLIENGFVQPAIYCRAERATLRLTSHKVIEFLASGAGTSGRLASFAAQARAMGLVRRRELRSVALGCHHYHYRPRGAFDHPSLVRRLRSDGFRKVAHLTE